MTKSFAILTVVLLVSGCTRAIPSLPGLDPSSLTDVQRAALPQAVEDFARVKQGLAPTCSSEPEVAFSDGGTSVFDCAHFRLLVRKSLALEDGVPGYYYGPVLMFDGAPPISGVRFYTSAQMSALLKERQNGR